MIIKLNPEAVVQLEALMKRTGRTSHSHTLHVMISTITNNLRRADQKKQKASNI